MPTWKLSNKAWDALDELRVGTADATMFRNATIILMSSVGRSKTLIAHDLGCSTSTVDIMRRRFRQRGLAGLVPAKPTGRRSEDTPEY